VKIRKNAAVLSHFVAMSITFREIAAKMENIL